jgi:putative chitinase
MITPETLRRFAPKIKDAETHAAALEEARQTSSVNTAHRLAYFMGQIFVETRGLTSMVESLRYKDPERLDSLFSAVRGIEDAKALIAQGEEPIGNRVYANRLGNGDEASGDGFRYRGSGYKQLTGRDNYREIGNLVHIDIEANPELARDPQAAAKVAFAFWDARGCSPVSDRRDVAGVTRLVNGPKMVGLAERDQATTTALSIWKA